ncbi:MAG: LrgB family protein, partial [Hyphomonas sp.]|nr:LrgB family protein [Hyphomonas sp.]
SVKGIAMGVAAHGIGTARAFQVSSQMGFQDGLAHNYSWLHKSSGSRHLGR